MATLVDAGVPLGIGLDGMSLDDDQDLLCEARLVGHAFARRTGEGAPFTSEMVLDGVWRVGRATVVGDDGGGRIEAKAPADLLILDLVAMTADCVAARPDPAVLMLGRATRRHVVGLTRQGRDIVRDGRCRTADRPALEKLLVSQARAAGGMS